VGALICALNEPIFDVLASLVYAKTPYVAYSAFGRDIPWTAALGYVPWVGLMPYLLSRMMTSGASRARLHLIAFALFLSVVLIEVLNAVWLDAWRYYGESAWRGVLGGGIAQMAAMPLLCALLYYVLGSNLSGWRRALLGIVLPAMTLPMVFAATTWSLYFSNHTDLPAVVDWAAAGFSVALCFAAVPTITRVAQRWHTGEIVLSRGIARRQDPREETPASAVAVTV
jgi:hypothetical protein